MPEELTRCKECGNFPPKPDKSPCEFCLAQYPQGNPTGFKDYFKAKDNGIRGVHYDLDVGICGHPKVLLFRGVHDGSCVQCLACLMEEPHDSCSGLMRERPDFDKLPKLPPHIFAIFERAAFEGKKVKELRQLLGIKNE